MNNQPDISESWTFSPKVLYEFTINGNDDAQWQGTFKALKMRYVRNRKLLREILFETPSIKYKLYPEISMPQYGRGNKNAVPRIHWHGVIRFPDEVSLLDWLLITQVKMAKYGSFQFNEFRPEYWPEYCTKNENLFSKLPGNYALENTFEFDKLMDTVIKKV